MFDLYLFLKKRLLDVCLIALSMTIIPAVYAKPDLTPLGENIADRGSQYYQFKVQNFQSLDQQRKYKVWLGIPKHIDKNKPLPAIYMLDGNSVMSRLDENQLKRLSEQDQLVLVAIGYQSNLPFESASRSVDYTPADASGKIQPDPRSPDRMSGGSQLFRQVVFEQIMPWVNARADTAQVTIDSQRTALWGHSYGGLFVLDTLLNNQQHPSRFSHYFAASPSLTWADSRILQAIAKTPSEVLQGQKLWVMEGDFMVSKATEVSSNLDHAMIENNRQMVLDLAVKGVDAKLVLYPNLSHGQVFQAALMDVLNDRLF